MEDNYNKILINDTVAGIPVAIFFDTRRVKEDLTFPVKYRITNKGNRFYHSSGETLTEAEWKDLLKTGKNTIRGKELLKKRDHILSGFKQIKDHIEKMIKNGPFDNRDLNIRLGRKNTKYIKSAFEVKMESLEQEGRPGTANAYQCALTSIIEYSGEKLKFTDITQEWLKKYEKSMTDKGRSITTVGMYLRALRAIINEGKAYMTSVPYPFGKGKYEIKTGSGRKMALTLFQIGEVLKYPLTTDVEKRCRDLWFFSYLTNGINIGDLLRLKYKNISGGEIHYIRQKTKRTSKEVKTISATMLPKMEDIIKAWGSKRKQPDDYIFPFLKHGMTPRQEKEITQNVVRLINKKMSIISDALKYDNISTYTARHSYATVLKRSGVDIAFISESLGHNDLKTTENYLASFEQEARAKNAQKLIPA